MAGKTVTACMLIIGNEILSGRTQDTNLNFLAKALNELGVRLTEARVIPDIEATIVETVNETRAKFDHVFTTGGIGPTHDDITAVCIAKAFGVDVVFHPDIAARIRGRETAPEIMESRLLMARVPQGATLIDNTTGGPQGFQMGNVFVMAGVPMVMQAMVGALTKERLGGTDPMRSRTIGAYLGESEVAKQLGELQAKHPAVDIGSYPFYRKAGYGTNLVIRGTDEAELEVLAKALRALITAMGAEAHDDGV
ncbi:competence/damage-inducible protein A [Halieaceae bacterium IMCC14734]|uniref:Competence/damage-inducible protein A n=1 Tax=Candidatus Litorirhabdus singularis TaxID=2518993 RepID=A0ABT3TME2_9GAMM|nr:molybdopterin-binding protein [Candidatus Litorirhabdus singularis]MCX2982891.1 competence/damage-inducible protein A [Candidatus Litorirhabdus singularis]